MLQELLCNNRGLLSRQNLSNTVARSIPGIFALVYDSKMELNFRDGKKELVFSSVLKVNRVASLSFSMHAVKRDLFKDTSNWLL